MTKSWDGVWLHLRRLLNKFPLTPNLTAVTDQGRLHCSPIGEPVSLLVLFIWTWTTQKHRSDQSTTLVWVANHKSCSPGILCSVKAALPVGESPLHGSAYCVYNLGQRKSLQICYVLGTSSDKICELLSSCVLKSLPPRWKVLIQKFLGINRPPCSVKCSSLENIAVQYMYRMHR